VYNTGRNVLGQEYEDVKQKKKFEGLENKKEWSV